MIRWNDTPEEAAHAAMLSLQRSWHPARHDKPTVWQVAVTPSFDIGDESIQIERCVSRSAYVRIRTQVKLPYKGAPLDLVTWCYDPQMWKDLAEDIAKQRAEFGK